MSVTTYSGLVATIADTLNRGDLTNAIPTFIRLAEAQMDRRIRVRRQTTRATASVNSEYTVVPVGFAGVRSFDLSTSPPTPLQFLEPAEMTKRKHDRYWPSGKPVFYSIVGEEFQFLPAPDGSYLAELTYWLRIPQLTPDNQVNWLITDNPDAYLYGSLLQAAPYLKDDDRVAMWEGFFTTIVDDINSDDAKMAGPLSRRGRRF